MDFQLVYVTNVDERGQISVSPIRETNSFPAQMISDFPTDLTTGQGQRAIPRVGDTAIALEMDQRYYILGFVNLHSDAGEHYNLEQEEGVSLLPHSVMWRLSKTGYVIYRQLNQVLMFLSPWGKMELSGSTDVEQRTEEWYTRFTTAMQRFWGGLWRWERDDSEEEQPDISRRTTHTAAYTRTHEPRSISDIDLDQDVRNPGIDNVSSIEGSIPSNPKNLGYIDKAIVRAGYIGDGHVYERETRQSVDRNKNKDAFSRMRAGNRGGTLYEIDTFWNREDIVRTYERHGLNQETLRILERYHGIEDAIQRELWLGQGTDEAIFHDRLDDLEKNRSWETEFGVDDQVLYQESLADDAGEVLIQKDTDGLHIDVDGVELFIGHNGEIHLGTDAEQPLVLGNNFTDYIEKVVKPWLLNHTHPTGVGPSGPASGGLPPYNQFPSAVDDPAKNKLNKSIQTDHKVKAK